MLQRRLQLDNIEWPTSGDTLADSWQTWQWSLWGRSAERPSSMAVRGVVVDAGGLGSDQGRRMPSASEYAP